MAIKDIFARLKNTIKIFFNTNNMQELLNGTRVISEDCPVDKMIYDEVEGNMTFTFKIVKDDHKSSYTNVVALDEHHADVIISNPDANPNGYGVKSDGLIRVGTYGGEYDLLLSFVLFKDEEKQWNIEYTFSISKKRNGSNK